MEGLMINGQLQYVKDMNDFIDLVDKYMGYDSAKWLENHIGDVREETQQLIDMMEECAGYLNSALDSLHYV